MAHKRVALALLLFNENYFNQGYVKGSAEALSSASVVYTYHQHSTSTTNQTVDQSTTPYSGSSAAAYVSTSGGCYTKPYYYYNKTVHHAGTPSQTVVCGTWYPNGDDSWTCSGCGYRQYDVSSNWSNGLPWGSTTHTKTIPGTSAWDETVSGSGWSIPSGATETSRVYYPDCGKNDGELIQATVHFSN